MKKICKDVLNNFIDTSAHQKIYQIKKMKKILPPILFILFFFTQQIEAQTWYRAIGLRLGFPNSITYKQFISEKAAIEGILGTRGFVGFRTTSLAGAYQIHNTLLDDEFGELRWYFGAGASLNLFSYDLVFTGNSGRFSIGAQGYIGVDYNFNDAPINLSLDWVPTVLFLGRGDGFSGEYGGFAIRYVF